jgi:adenosylhomocysteinase
MEEKREEEGLQKINWVSERMPVLKTVKNFLVKEKIFDGLKIGMSIHIEAKTANLVFALSEAGASVYVAGSNTLSTQDDIAYILSKRGVNVFAWRGETEEDHLANLRKVLDNKPDLIVDDGGDLTVLLSKELEYKELTPIGGTEETTTGINRITSLESEGLLRFPVIGVNNASTKHLFDNRFGTGESVLSTIMNITNLSIATKNLVVAGYGWVGRGIAGKARAFGAKVYITEVDPVKAMEADFDGFYVYSMDEASKIGDIFITTTGNINVITQRHFELMKDGAILCNAGHFNKEIDVQALNDFSSSKRVIKPNIDEYFLYNGKRLYLIGKGDIVNLIAGDGKPAEIMDLSFSLEALSLEYLVRNRGGFIPKLYAVPNSIDLRIAELYLGARGIKIDRLDQTQKQYRSSWF